MSDADEIHPTKVVKQKLDSIFGSFESFSQILTNPSIRRSHVHGVVPHPITPLIENMPVRSPIEELVDNHSQPGPSTVAVLESMKGIVEGSPLSHLGSSSPYFTEPAPSTVEKSKHDKKRNALKDEKQRDSSKKRKIEISATEEKANVRVAETPPGKRNEQSKAMIKKLFGTTSDDDEERLSEPSRSSVTKKENGSWTAPKPQINSAKNEDMKKSKNKDPIDKSIDAPENDKNKKKEANLNTKLQTKIKMLPKLYANDDSTSHIPTSPDSGISSMAGSTTSEAKERMLEETVHWPVERILGEFANMEPLLSPLHDSEKPAPELENRQTIDKVKNETNVIRCKLDLSILPTTDRQRLIESWRRANRFKNELNSPNGELEPKPLVNEQSKKPKVHEYKEKVEKSCDVSSSKEVKEIIKKEDKPLLNHVKKEEPTVEPVARLDKPADKIIGEATIIKASDSPKKKEPIVPLAKEVIEEPPGRVNRFNHFQNQARNTKHKGDNENDKIEKALYYLESVVFFIMSAHVHNPSDANASQSSLTSETYNFLKFAMNMFLHSRADLSSFSSIRSRVKILGTLIQACLTYRLYDLRSEQALKNYHILNQYEKDNPSSQNQSGQKPSALSSNGATPSPSSSTHSSNLSSGPSPKDKISVPVQIYNIQSNQLKLLNNLILGHKMWKDAVNAIAHENQHEFMTKLNELCGEIKLENDLKQLAEYLLTGVRWLRREYSSSKGSGKR